MSSQIQPAAPPAVPVPRQGLVLRPTKALQREPVPPLGLTLRPATAQPLEPVPPLELTTTALLAEPVSLPRLQANQLRALDRPAQAPPHPLMPPNRRQQLLWTRRAAR
jgi:hypothetical protein